ncbi:prion-inhibition and propagation-domain-containing protein [Diaporthe sp. PMI_573]|nr:prion-inhibition and propagation-domain-containing protein [Diaporthaceae sp. PMI_573]KAH8749706.1 prion-inhibition and propagation-domain-containing protein [Diaporthaceae sp. PMI_573]
MDPVSFAGIGLSVASLAIQLFNGCMTVFNFLTELIEMPESCATRRLRLLIEYNRLMAWGKAAGLVEFETGSTLASALGASALEIAAILSEVRTLLEAFANLNSKHEELRLSGIQGQMRTSLGLSPDVTLQDLSSIKLLHDRPRKAKTLPTRVKTIARTMKALGGLTKRPKQVIWQLVDEKKFDGLLVRLQELINRLYELISQHRADELHKLTRNTFMEMVQLQESVFELRCLIAATADFPSKDAGGESGKLIRNSAIHELAQLKQIVNGESGRDMAIQIHQLSYRPGESNQRRARGRYISTCGEKPVQVWIEWKHYKEVVDRNPSSGLLEHCMPSTTLERTRQLAHLLSAPKPSDFCTPNCLGYTLEPERHNCGPRLGWVFRMPDQLSPEAAPRSLLWLFTNLPQPPLTDRVAIAKKIAACILNIHAVNWLHKAMRTENILFFNYDSTSDSAVPDLASPLLTGFDIARPEDHDTSERPIPAPKRDIYRWPSMQGDEPANGWSRKIFDIYGFGLVLLELAYWRPLHQILGFQEVSTITAREARDVRDSLLNKEPGHLEGVLRLLGRRYHGVVKRCLQGYALAEDRDVGLGIFIGEDERDPRVSVRLQRCYAEKVVGELRRIEL